MTTVRGKLVTLGGQQRFFPAVSPRGALDSARDRGHARDDHEDDDHGEHDAHDAALEHLRDCSDEQAEEIQDALDRRAGARDRKKARDALPDNDDHRRDFRSNAADLESTRSSEEAYRISRDVHHPRGGRTADSRPGASDGVTGDSARRGQRLTHQEADLLAGVRDELKA